MKSTRESFRIVLTMDLPIAAEHGAVKGKEFSAWRVEGEKGLWFKSENGNAKALPGEYKVVEYDSGDR